MGLKVSNIRVLCLNTLYFEILSQSSVLAEEQQGGLLNTGLTLKSDSNITRTAEKKHGKSAVFLPRLQFFSNFGKHQFVLNYQDKFAAYNDNNQYSYNNQALNLAALFDHSYQINFIFNFGCQNKFEETRSNNAQARSSFSSAQNSSDTRKSVNIVINHGLQIYLDISLTYRRLARSYNDRIYTFLLHSVALSLIRKFD